MQEVVITEECPRCTMLEHEKRELVERVDQLGRVRASLQDQQARDRARIAELQAVGGFPRGAP